MFITVMYIVGDFKDRTQKTALVTAHKCNVTFKEECFYLQTKFFLTEKTVDMMIKEIAEQDPWVRKL